MGKALSKRTIAITVLGTTLEWTEFVYYGYISTIIAALFFPNQSKDFALLATFSVFAMSFLAKPIGSMIFGHFGDKWGRKPALIASMILMGVATVGIGVLPTYNSIGILAPFLLAILRIVQGIAVGGEYHGAAVFLIEKSSKEKKLWAGSIVTFAAACGVLLGTFAAFIISQPAMPVWAWRAPFILSGASCILVFYLRGNLTETKEFLHTKENKQIVNIPLLSVVDNNYWSLLYTAAISATVGTFFYVNNLYYMNYLSGIGISSNLSYTVTMLGQIIVALIILTFALARKLNYLRLFKLGVIGVVFASPMMFVLAHLDLIGLIFSCLIYGIVGGIISGPFMRITFELFPTNVRYTGMSVAWNIGAALFSGTSMSIAQWLHMRFALSFLPGLYASIIACSTLVIAHIYEARSKQHA